MPRGFPSLRPPYSWWSLYVPFNGTLIYWGSWRVKHSCFLWWPPPVPLVARPCTPSGAPYTSNGAVLYSSVPPSCMRFLALTHIAQIPASPCGPLLYLQVPLPYIPSDVPLYHEWRPVYTLVDPCSIAASGIPETPLLPQQASPTGLRVRSSWLMHVLSL